MVKETIVYVYKHRACINGFFKRLEHVWSLCHWPREFVRNLATKHLNGNLAAKKAAWVF